MFDLQTHLLPERAETNCASWRMRMGYADTPKQAAAGGVRERLADKTELNRKILDHLLHDAFGDDAADRAGSRPGARSRTAAERIDEVLGRTASMTVDAAYRNLMALATEKIRFLSTRRCRHFLAAIAPRLLAAIAATPDPDSTLVNLSQVSDSLGGKGVLWELFSFNPPSLNLYVRLCASCPYLSGILTSNPGMIDELMDSLVLDKLPTMEVLHSTLADLS